MPGEGATARVFHEDLEPAEDSAATLTFSRNDQPGKKTETAQGNILEQALDGSLFSHLETISTEQLEHAVEAFRGHEATFNEDRLLIERVREGRETAITEARMAAENELLTRRIQEYFDEFSKKLKTGQLGYGNGIGQKVDHVVGLSHGESVQEQMDRAVFDSSSQTDLGWLKAARGSLASGRPPKIESRIGQLREELIGGLPNAEKEDSGRVSIGNPQEEFRIILLELTDSQLAELSDPSAFLAEFNRRGMSQSGLELEPGSGERMSSDEINQMQVEMRGLVAEVLRMRESELDELEEYLWGEQDSFEFVAQNEYTLDDIGRRQDKTIDAAAVIEGVTESNQTREKFKLLLSSIATERLVEIGSQRPRN